MPPRESDTIPAVADKRSIIAAADAAAEAAATATTAADKAKKYEKVLRDACKAVKSRGVRDIALVRRFTADADLRAQASLVLLSETASRCAPCFVLSLSYSCFVHEAGCSWLGCKCASPGRARLVHHSLCRWLATGAGRTKSNFMEKFQALIDIKASTTAKVAVLVHLTVGLGKHLLAP